MIDKKATTSSRARAWATVIYPESMPENVFELIGDLKVPVLVSPLHDKDVNPNGEPKKPHYHVLTYFEGKKSEEQIREIFVTFGGVGVEKVASLRGYARYLTHKDNPEKAQYNDEDVRAFGGIDYASTIGLPTDKYKAISEMLDCIDEQGITSFARLMDYARHNRYDWFRVLCDNGTYVVKEYIKSQVWTREHGE